jgi:2-oxoisovalerate dehydrogenase E1 component beta subunit
MHTTTSLRPLAARLSPRLRSRLNSSKAEPPAAGGHSSLIADSKLLKSTRDTALRTPGISWTKGDTTMLGGRETRKMNTYQAVRDAMR